MQGIELVIRIDDSDDDAVRAGLASRNSEDRGRKRKPSQQAPDERASSSTRPHPAQADRKRRSDGDDADRYDDNRDVEVGQVADKRKESALRRETWDEDARSMSKSFHIENCRQAMKTMQSCFQSQYILAEVYSPLRVVKEANNMGMRGGFPLDFTAPDPDGYLWDFSEHECRQKAFAKIQECRPYMFGDLQNVRRSRPSRT